MLMPLVVTGRGATQVAILDLRREDAEQAGNEMVARFGASHFLLARRFRALHDLIEKYRCGSLEQRNPANSEGASSRCCRLDATFRPKRASSVRLRRSRRGLAGSM